MVEETSSNYAVIQDTQLMFQTTITSLQESIRKHESRFAKILPVLVSVNQGLPSASVADIDQKHAKLSQVIEELQEKQWQSALTPSTQGFDSRSSAQLDANVRDIKAQLQTLQLRIVGNGVQIGGVLFQCFQDVKTWVVSRFQIKRYGLFVDGVSLLDFFSFVSHTDTEKYMSAFFNQVKSGFVSMHEARVAASTQNLFPMVFGRSNSAGMDDSEYLPALQDPDKWAMWRFNLNPLFWMCRMAIFPVLNSSGPPGRPMRRWRLMCTTSSMSTQALLLFWPVTSWITM